MDATYLDYALILGIVALASYIQTISGFSFGVIIVGGVSGFHLMSVADVAVVVSLMAIVNTGTAMSSKGLANVQWREGGLALLVSFPFMAAGLFLLDYLSGAHIEILRIILGLVILASGVLLLRPPKADAVMSGLPSFAAAGAVAGVMGGIFSTGGPPVVFQFYRQPLPVDKIRDSLMVLYCMSAVVRTIFVAFDTGIEMRLLLLALGAVPVIVLFTKIGQRFAPNLSVDALRRLVFILLSLTALLLMTS